MVVSDYGFTVSEFWDNERDLDDTHTKSYTASTSVLMSNSYLNYGWLRLVP